VEGQQQDGEIDILAAYEMMAAVYREKEMQQEDGEA